MTTKVYAASRKANRHGSGKSYRKKFKESENKKRGEFVKKDANHRTKKPNHPVPIFRV